MIYLTTAPVTIQADNITLQLNQALAAQTITLSGSNGGTFAVISGTTSVGARFIYTGLRSRGIITITPSATVDAAVNNTNLGI